MTDTSQNEAIAALLKAKDTFDGHSRPIEDKVDWLMDAVEILLLSIYEKEK